MKDSTPTRPKPNNAEIRAIRVIALALDGSVPCTTTIERMADNMKTALAVSIVAALNASGLLID